MDSEAGLQITTFHANVRAALLYQSKLLKLALQLAEHRLPFYEIFRLLKTNKVSIRLGMLLLRGENKRLLQFLQLSGVKFESVLELIRLGDVGEAFTRLEELPVTAQNKAEITGFLGMIAYGIWFSSLEAEPMEDEEALIEYLLSIEKEQLSSWFSKAKEKLLESVTNLRTLEQEFWILLAKIYLAENDTDAAFEVLAECPFKSLNLNLFRYRLARHLDLYDDRVEIAMEIVENDPTIQDKDVIADLAIKPNDEDKDKKLELILLMTDCHHINDWKQEFLWNQLERVTFDPPHDRWLKFHSNGMAELKQKVLERFGPLYSKYQEISPFFKGTKTCKVCNIPGCPGSRNRAKCRYKKPDSTDPNA